MRQSALSNILTLFCLVGKVLSQATCPSFIWGPEYKDDRVSYDTGCTDEKCKSFLVFDRPTGCYGKIKEWEFFHSNVCHDIIFQVYRPTTVGSKNYKLIGENLLEFSLTDNDCYNYSVGVEQNFTFEVPRELQIPIHPDDLIGWHDLNFGENTTERLFTFEEGNSGSNQFDVIHILEESDSCRTINHNCSWDTSYGKVQVLGRTYSLNAHYEIGDKPSFENLPANAQISEHSLPGSFVFQVTASNYRNWNDVVPVEISYSIISVSDVNGDVTNENLFSINETTGEVFTMKELDHEKIAAYFPDGTREAYYTISIAARQQETGPEHLENLYVNIIDINEKHDITNLPTSETINSALTGADAQVFVVEHEELLNEDFLTQDNETYWPEKIYMMVNGNPAVDVFQIDALSGQITTRLDLRDWHGPNTTMLYVTCTDGYFTTSPKALTVILTTLRQPPHLENLPNTVSVPEDTSNDPALYTVTSYVDIRGTARYDIAAVYPPVTNPVDGTDPFRINNNTGVVSIVNAVFDYRDVHKYEVEILIHDGLYDSKPENLTVEITFVNTAPVWGTTNYNSSLPELSPVGTVVPGIYLQSTDADIPLGDWIDYIINGTGSNLFHADNETHQIYIAAEYSIPCKDEEETFFLQIIVYDSSGALDVTDLTINMTDINNNAPQFDSEEYTGEVNELWLGQTTVQGVTLRIWDCDSNEHYGVIDIVVVEEYARDYFEIAYDCNTICVTGLYLKQSISHTDYANITFTILASDKGSPRLNGTAMVFIKVEDENNHPPEFIDEFYDTEVRSDVNVGTTVNLLEVTDLDSDINSNVTFFLLIPDDYFTVDGNTGTVENFKNLGYYHKHILYAYARDHADPELFSDPSIVRIDTYPPKQHLVDIHMDLPLNEFKLIVDEFLFKLNQQIAPWVAKEELNLLDRDRSVLTIYALTEAPPTTQDSLNYDKSFVHVDDLLKVLRTDLQGTPKDWLRGPNFSEYQVFKVVHTYPTWLVDTIPGIATLTLLCCLLLCLLLFVVYLIYKQHLRNKVEPASKSPPPRYQTPQFDLRYAEYNHAPRENIDLQDGPFFSGETRTSSKKKHGFFIDWNDEKLSVPSVSN